MAAWRAAAAARQRGARGRVDRDRRARGLTRARGGPPAGRRRDRERARGAGAAARLATPPAGRVRRGRGHGGRLQHPARRGAVRARGAARHARAAARAAGARDRADRDSGRLARCPQGADVSDRRTLRARLADRVGAARRAARGPALGPLHPLDRARAPIAAGFGARAAAGADRRVRGARPAVDRLPAGARQRQERRAARPRRADRGRPVGGADGAEADRDSGLPRQRCARGSVHADALLRRAGRQPRRPGVGARVARRIRSAPTR